MLPGGAENQRPSVLASLRAIEALKPVLARVMLARTCLPWRCAQARDLTAGVRIGGA